MDHDMASSERSDPTFRPDRFERSFPLVVWGITAGVLAVLVIVDRYVPEAGPWRNLTNGWTQFDGVEYRRIARLGYERRQLVWFPLYPSLIRVVMLAGISATTAGIGISLVAGATSATLLWRWICDHVPTVTARRWALAFTLAYPYGWYLFGVLHSDALFLALVLAAFLLIEQDRPGWAALAGALATATRPTGVVLTLPLVILSLNRSGVLVFRSTPAMPRWVNELRLPFSLNRAAFRWRALWPAAALVGLVTYCLYTWVVWGDPLAFANEQRRYHGSGWRLMLKKQYFDAWSQGFDGRHLATTTVQAGLLVLTLLSIAAVGRRFGWGYGAWVGGLAWFPGMTVSTFMGIGRYLIPAFPMWVLFGERLAGSKWRFVVLPVSYAILALLAVGFSRSWYLT